MRKFSLTFYVFLVFLYPNSAFSQHDLLPLARDIHKQVKVLSSIHEDVNELCTQLIVNTSNEDMIYSFLFSDAIYRTYLIYLFTNNALNLINSEILTDRTMDECKEQKCKDMVWFHEYLALGAALEAKNKIEYTLGQMRLLTVKIHNRRLSYQLNRIMDITSSTLYIAKQWHSKLEENKIKKNGKFNGK